MWRSSDSQVRSIRQDRTRIVILILTSLLAGCISTGGYIKGQVIDADTGEPIANAHVAIIWKGDAFAFVETQSADIRADATLTDANGTFRFWPWVQWDRILLLSDVHYSNIIVYKTGYFETYYYHLLNRMRGKTFPQGNADLYLLRRLEKGDLSRREYMDYLLKVSSWASCGTDQAHLVPIKRAAYTEAERFAKTNDEKEIADTILSWLMIALMEPPMFALMAPCRGAVSAFQTG